MEPIPQTNPDRIVGLEPRASKPRRYPKKFLKFKRMLLTRPDLSPTDIAHRTYTCKNDNVARTIASRNMRALRLTFKDTLERIGLTDERDATDLLRLRGAKITKFFAHKGTVLDEREVEDNDVQLRALELTRKIKGDFFRDENGNLGIIGGVTVAIIIDNNSPVNVIDVAEAKGMDDVKVGVEVDKL